MLFVVIFVIVLMFYFVWKYCVSCDFEIYILKWVYLIKIEVVVWLVFIFIIIVLGVIIWCLMYVFDFYVLLEGKGEYFIVEVVLFNWKWLFIYLE